PTGNRRQYVQQHSVIASSSVQDCPPATARRQWRGPGKGWVPPGRRATPSALARALIQCPVIRNRSIRCYPIKGTLGRSADVESMTVSDHWTEVLRCPNCALTGVAVLSQPNGSDSVLVMLSQRFLKLQIRARMRET